MFFFFFYAPDGSRLLVRELAVSSRDLGEG